MYRTCISRGAVALATILGACSQDLGPTPPGSAPQPTMIAIRAATTGESLDPDGYDLRIDPGSGDQEIRWLATNGVVALSLWPGTVRFALSGASPNCTVAGMLERSITIAEQATADSTRFDVACVHAHGTILVRTSLAEAKGPGPFIVTLDGGQPRSLAAVDSTEFTDLADGVHRIGIGGVHPTDACETSTAALGVAVSSGTSQPITFTRGGESSSVTCECGAIPAWACE